uniref:Uncharacterized protein n=1 Tax=Rhinopithecus bieti TaxID=61621 RepID=A0A2K6LML3_RHIBE
MPLAAPPALLLPLLGLAAAAVVDCPSSTWIQFQDKAIKVESIEDVRNQCTDHGADMISIHNEEENAFILDTLKSNGKFFLWKEHCKTAIPYKRKYLSDNHILISALVIANTVILTVLGAITWFLYKKHSDSRFTTVFSTAPQSPYNED